MDNKEFADCMYRENSFFTFVMFLMLCVGYLFCCTCCACLSYLMLVLPTVLNSRRQVILDDVHDPRQGDQSDIIVLSGVEFKEYKNLV